MAITHRKVFIYRGFSVQSHLSGMRPGDLIFGMKSNDATGNIISAYQKNKGYQELACSATHVALYVGQGEVIHAVVPEVCLQQMDEYFLNRPIAIATWEPPAELDMRREALVERLIDEATQYLGQQYEITALIRSVATDLADTSPLVCSTMIDAIFDDVFDAFTPFRDPENSPIKLTSPAHLFAQEALLTIIGA